MYKSSTLSDLLIFSFFFNVSLLSAQVVCSSTGSGPWHFASTWNCDHVPEPGDWVIIEDGHTVTIFSSIYLDEAGGGTGLWPVGQSSPAPGAGGQGIYRPSSAAAIAVAICLPRV